MPDTTAQKQIIISADDARGAAERSFGPGFLAEDLLDLPPEIRLKRLGAA